MAESSHADLPTLLIENSMLAERLQASEADRDQVMAASQRLREQLESALARLAETSAASEAAEVRARSLQEERDRLGESVALADTRLREEPAAAFLAPAEVSALIDRLLASLGSQLSGLSVRDAELRLKVGVRKLGQQAGFVVPGPDSPPEVRETLHEISVRFNRAPEQ